ncbi:CIR protein, partial [Plasmodium chabaudi adami]
HRKFATIDDYFYVTDDGQVRVDTQHTSILQYCNYENNSGPYNCNDYFQLTSCGFVYLLKTLKDNYKLEDDKLAEYVILWLSYKLNRHSKCSGTNLNDFYTNHIEKNEYYNKKIKDDDTTTYKDIIDKKKDLMDIKEISKFSGLFSILFYLYYLFHVERLNCENNLNLANNFGDIFKELNEDSNNKENSSYNKLLSTLSNDYNILINKYGKNKCTNFKSLPELTPQKSFAQPTTLIPEGTPSSSSILNTVIPVLSTFSHRKFATIDDYFYVTDDGQVRVDTQHTSILQYCNYENNSGPYNCNDYFQLTSCGFVYLLKTLKDNYKLEDDKLAEYVILWLSYKLNRHSKCSGTNLNDFYTNHIEKNEYYNKKIKDDDTTTYKDIIDKKKDLMDIKEISKFSGLFSILFYLYYLFHVERLNCENNLNLANNFGDIFKELNEDSNNKENSSYNKLLSTLSNDYNILINKYGKNKCTNFKSLPELTPQKSFAQPTTLIPEGTPSSSSILNTVIPVLSTFSVISLFLGVAYKVNNKEFINIIF